MADARRRELERAAAGGDDAARGALLIDRLRSQELAEDRLWLAAYLRDTGALHAVQSAFAVELPEKRLGTWLRGLGKHIGGRLPFPWKPYATHVAARAALVLCEEGRPLWKKERARTARLEKTLGMVQGWLEDPSQERANGIVSANLGVASSAPAIAAMELASIVHSKEPRQAASAAAEIGGMVLAAMRRAGRSQKQADIHLRGRVRDALLPWVLG